jgi:tRNA G46 methylase TrmB
MTPTWSMGYAVGVEYVATFGPDQNAHVLALASLIGGYEPPDLAARYSFCELGCGLGLSLILHAAADPRGQFLGIDFNPAHIVRARKLAAVAGVVNVEFREASFDELMT